MTASLTTSDLAAVRRAVIRQCCEDDHLFFTRYFFKQRQGIKFLVNWHHRAIADALEDVLQGRTKNLLINVPPGSSKTEMAVINFIARGLALNPLARFLHLSYSDDLAALNSSTAKDLVTSDEFQELWPLKTFTNTNAKKRWNVEVNGRAGGGCYAASLGGQITGFRAGHMAPGFQGAIIIDDPLKPEDAYSKTKRAQANRKLLSTVKSRKANPDTPIIVIMQRLAEEDPSGFILKGKLGGNWKFIKIPALMSDKDVEAQPPKIRAIIPKGQPRDAKGRFSYWEYKEPLADLLEMEKGGNLNKSENPLNAYVFSGQYQQAPTPIGGGLIKGGWFGRYKVLPRLKYRLIFGDTALKTAERNDYSVLICFGLGVDGNLYLLDLLRGKWESQDLETNTKDFWNKHKPKGPIHIMGALRRIIVEDKASGTGLVQSIRAKLKIPIDGLERDTDKLTRLLDVQGYIKSGYVCIPEEADFVSEFVKECEAFTPDDTHEHDDQIDPLIDAIKTMLAGKDSGPNLGNLGKM